MNRHISSNILLLSGQHPPYWRGQRQHMNVSQNSIQWEHSALITIFPVATSGITPKNSIPLAFPIDNHYKSKTVNRTPWTANKANYDSFYYQFFTHGGFLFLKLSWSREKSRGFFVPGEKLWLDWMASIVGLVPSSVVYLRDFVNEVFS